MSTNQIVAQTTRDLQRLTAVVRRAGKTQRLQVERLTAEFKEAVQRYGQAQKVCILTFKLCFLLDSYCFTQQMATRLRASALVRSPVLMEEEERQDTELEEQQRLLAKQRQLQREMEFEHGMLQERERRMRQIEEDILDVNEIMRELSVMVHDQGESISKYNLCHKLHWQHINTDILNMKFRYCICQ
jgi:t-SNARE domain-containing protein 1